MSTAFTIVQLRYFRTVARLENMTAAARELNVTQSTLSSAMAALERAMGTQLFVRSPSRAPPAPWAPPRCVDAMGAARGTCRRSSLGRTSSRGRG